MPASGCAVVGSCSDVPAIDNKMDFSSASIKRFGRTEAVKCNSSVSPGDMASKKTNAMQDVLPEAVSVVSTQINQNGP